MHCILGRTPRSRSDTGMSAGLGRVSGKHHRSFKVRHAGERGPSLVALSVVLAVLVTALLGSPGTAAAAPRSGPVVGVASTTGGEGYWLAHADGVVEAFGEARFHGDLRSRALVKPIVGIAATATGDGYWLVSLDGGIFAFGDAPFHGSMGGRPLNRPVVSMSPTPSGRGYWLVATDGGIFSFGDARFYGSMGGRPLARPVNGMTVSPSGGGYRMVASDGGIFSFGDAAFVGSTGAQPPERPVVGMTPAPVQPGYWTVTDEGQVFAFGTAQHLGDLAGVPLPAPVAGIAGHPSAQGYLIVLADGQARRFGAGVSSSNVLRLFPHPGPSRDLLADREGVRHPCTDLTISLDMFVDYEVPGRVEVSWPSRFSGRQVISLDQIPDSSWGWFERTGIPLPVELGYFDHYAYRWTYPGAATGPLSCGALR